MNVSLQLANFYLRLDEVKKLIYNELIPSGLHLQCPDEELLQTLEIAAQNIETHLKNYKLQAQAIKSKEGEC